MVRTGDRLDVPRGTVIGLTVIGLPPAVARPCNDCPWRRRAAPGWLGPYPPEGWLEIAHSDQPIACHRTIEQDGDWETERIRQCAGAAIFRQNVAKSPRPGDDAAHAFEPDKENVFATDAEFVEHHGQLYDRYFRRNDR